MADPQTHDIGDRRKLTCEVRDESGALVDPVVLTFYMREPDGVLTTYDLTDTEVVRDSVGVFHTYWDITQSGTHNWRWAASGNVGAAEETSFKVKASKVLDPPA